MADWTANPTGDANEHEAEINGHVVSICSDPSGQSWEVYIDGDVSKLDATTLEAAQAEAEQKAQQA